MQIQSQNILEQQMQHKNAYEFVCALANHKQNQVVVLKIIDRNKNQSVPTDKNAKKVFHITCIRNFCIDQLKLLITIPPIPQHQNESENVVRMITTAKDKSMRFWEYDALTDELRTLNQTFIARKKITTSFIQGNDLFYSDKFGDTYVGALPLTFPVVFHEPVQIKQQASSSSSSLQTQQSQQQLFHPSLIQSSMAEVTFIFITSYQRQHSNSKDEANIVKKVKKEVVDINVNLQKEDQTPVIQYYLLVCDFYHRVKIFHKDNPTVILNIWSPDNRGIVKQMAELDSAHLLVIFESQLAFEVHIVHKSNLGIGEYNGHLVYSLAKEPMLANIEHQQQAIDNGSCKSVLTFVQGSSDNLNWRFSLLAESTQQLHKDQKDKGIETIYSVIQFHQKEKTWMHSAIELFRIKGGFENDFEVQIIQQFALNRSFNSIITIFINICSQASSSFENVIFNQEFAEQMQVSEESVYSQQISEYLSKNRVLNFNVLFL